MRSKFNVNVVLDKDEVKVDVTPKKEGWLARFKADFKEGFREATDPLEREKARLRKDTIDALADAMLKDVYAELDAAKDADERAKALKKAAAKAMAG